MSAVSLQEIYKVYGAHVGVRGISLEIPDQAFVVLVGPSGCGKSTTLRMIAGLETISHGELWIGGKLANDLPSRDRRTAMVFQSYALYPHMTVRKNLAFSLKLARLSKVEIEQRIDHAAKILELEPYLDRKPGSLSGGQRQRVAMGRAIVREPEVFLFDEPLSNLDAKLRSQMRIEIKRLQRRLKVTTVYVTHDQVEAMTLADIMVVMKDGRIAQVGTPLQVFENPDSLFVAGFIGSPQMNFVEGQVVVADGGLAFASPGLKVPLDSRFSIAAGQSVSLGVRPEDLVPQGHGVPPVHAVDLMANVSLTEMLGNETLLFISVGTSELVARMQQPRDVGPNEAMRFQLNIDRIHLFDATTGASLRASATASAQASTGPIIGLIEGGESRA
jgi:multiple sugar transport system ATP-binding protein